MKNTAWLLCVVFALAGVGTALAQANAQTGKDIPANVIEIFKKNCAGCHTGQRPPKGLSLIPSKVADAINAPSAEKPALKLIDTANPEASYLLKKILGARDITGSRMPRGKHMAEADIEVLKAWILGLKK
jgi:mono/diheme cytochrome c family protein